MNTGKIISVDAETNGLWGNPFSIGAVVYQNGKEIDRFVGRIPDNNVTNKWVQENVLPTLDFAVNYPDLDEMLRGFASFYIKHKDATALWHMVT